MRPGLNLEVRSDGMERTFGTGQFGVDVDRRILTGLALGRLCFLNTTANQKILRLVVACIPHMKNRVKWSISERIEIYSGGHPQQIKPVETFFLPSFGFKVSIMRRTHS